MAVELLSKERPLLRLLLPPLAFVPWSVQCPIIVRRLAPVQLELPFLPSYHTTPNPPLMTTGIMAFQAFQVPTTSHKCSLSHDVVLAS